MVDDQNGDKNDASASLRELMAPLMAWATNEVKAWIKVHWKRAIAGEIPAPSPRSAYLSSACGCEIVQIAAPAVIFTREELWLDVFNWLNVATFGPTFTMVVVGALAVQLVIVPSAIGAIVWVSTKPDRPCATFCLYGVLFIAFLWVMFWLAI